MKIKQRKKNVVSHYLTLQNYTGGEDYEASKKVYEKG